MHAWFGFDIFRYDLHPAFLDPADLM